MTTLEHPDLDELNHNCPKCGADWRNKEIDRESLEKDYYGHIAPCQRKNRWDDGCVADEPCTCPTRYHSRLIGIELPWKYDGVVIWLCPDCKTQWDRFTGEEV